MSTPDECAINQVSSRVCELGTKGCVEEHVMCAKCKTPLVRSHCCEDYLVWSCSCTAVGEIKHFSDIDGDDWVFVINYYNSQGEFKCQE